MARMTLTALLIVLVHVLVGCNEGNISDVRQIRSADQRSAACMTFDTANAGEVDIAEHVNVSRQAYRKGLETLIEYYCNTGNNMKLAWAQEELASLGKVMQYDYIVEAAVPGPELRAQRSILEANYIFADIVRLENKARFLFIVNQDQLRDAMVQYVDFIKRYPTSDKIDDAAFRVAGINEHFQDHAVAALYYKRAYQWDNQTTTPAAFKAAYILDRRLHRMDEALALYRIAAKSENLTLNYREFAKMRIDELTQTETTNQ